MSDKTASLLARAKAARKALTDSLEAGGTVTPAQQTIIDDGMVAAEELLEQRSKADAEREPSAGAKAKAAELIKRLDNLGQGSSSSSTKAGTQAWAKSVTDKLRETAGSQGLKALLVGEIDVAPAVGVAALPDNPVGIVDLVPRANLDQHTWSYLRQVARQLNAAPVADGETKPTSTMSFEEIEDRARVIAHLSEPFPIRYASDYESMMKVIDHQMAQGLIEAIEFLMVNGDGAGENWTGILQTEGITEVTFAGDAITSLRRARTALENKGEVVTGFALNPNDAEAIDLLREDGEAGGFLMDSDAYRRIFGQGSRGVTSLAVPEGTAIVGDWNQTRLLIREGGHTMASTQSGDLFDTNQMKLRTEGRYGFEIGRPQALAVVDLAAA